MGSMNIQSGISHKEVRESKRIHLRGIIKTFIILLLIILQIRLIVLILYVLQKQVPWLSTFITYATMVVMLYIYARNISPSFKLFWILLIVAFPVAGLCIYVLGGRANANKKMRKKFENVEKRIGEMLTDSHPVPASLREEDPACGNLAHYLTKFAWSPVYQRTAVNYYSDASMALKEQIDALKAAKKYIFIEYLTIEDGTAFHEIKEILIQKATEGVIIRMIYDDMGCTLTLRKSFQKEMESFGIECRRFNPILPVLNVFMNNRDHRRLCVVDGTVGFTGGYNLANQYFNITHPYGYCKDVGVRIMGEAVRSMTRQFLMMWETLGNEDQNIDKFLNDETKNKDCEKALSSGSFINSHSYIQPYCDDPLDEELVSEEIYLTLIRKANHYIWISTPYLIITDEIRNELVSAAKKGVDVRIFVPGIPDKKIVNQCTKSYYGRLTVGGVKIFEYCPGFNHAKLCICDDRMALVGTANLDYRSLYHHFENGIVIYNNSVITDIKNDMEHMADVSRQITLSNLIAVPKWKKAARMLIRLCAPML